MPQAVTAPMLGVPAQRGRGIAILAVTGLITAQALVLGIRVATGYQYTPAAGTNFPFDSSPWTGLLGVIAWLLVAPWMATAARGAAQMGYLQTHQPWVAWWGWVFPIWNLWAPYRFMKDATQGFAVRKLGLWWATWLLSPILIWSSSSSTTVDSVVTETHISTSLPFNAVALTMSWILFARIVWTVSQGSDAVDGPQTIQYT